MKLSEKQLEIIRIAQTMFAKNGFEGTCVRDIAQAADINVAMINYYFGSKENLLETIIKWGIETYKLNPSQYESEEDPIYRLEKMVEHYVSSKINNPSVYQILISEASIRKRKINEELFTELRKHNIECIRRVIEYGVQKGTFSTYDPILIHTTMIGTFMHFNYNRAFYEQTLPKSHYDNFDDYLAEIIIKHLKFTIKAILTHENQ